MMENSSLGCREIIDFSRRSELRSRSVVDLRVVDVLVVNVILDIYELTAIGLSVIVTLTGLSYPIRSGS